MFPTAVELSSTPGRSIPSPTKEAVASVTRSQIPNLIPNQRHAPLIAVLWWPRLYSTACPTETDLGIEYGKCYVLYFPMESNSPSNQPCLRKERPLPGHSLQNLQLVLRLQDYRPHQVMKHEALEVTHLMGFQQHETCNGGQARLQVTRGGGRTGTEVGRRRPDRDRAEGRPGRNRDGETATLVRTATRERQRKVYNKLLRTEQTQGNAAPF